MKADYIVLIKMRFFGKTASAAAMLLMAESASAQGGFGLADVPQMGWSTWYALGCETLTADAIKQQADLLVSSGLSDLGFKYVLVDDCWQSRARNQLSFLEADLIRFPNGFKEVSDYVHDKGLLIGIYSSAGTKTCAGYPGTLGYEYEDVKQWAEWEVDYIKYDNCNNMGVPAEQRYGELAK